MKSEKQLKQLMGIRAGIKTATEKMCNYLEYIGKNRYSLDVMNKTKLFQEWYSSVSNSIGAILASKDCFSVAYNMWESFEKTVKKPVPIPKKLQSSFGKDDDVSYERVLRIARNHQEHPDKANQEQFVFLADTISVDSLKAIQDEAIILFDTEVTSLSQEEVNLMVRESMELKRDVYAMQDTLLPFLDYLQSVPGVTASQIKTLKEFIQYTPASENIVFYDPNGKTKQ